MPCPVCHQLHRERAMTGRIFQALPNFCPHRQTPCLLIYIRSSLGAKRGWVVPGMSRGGHHQRFYDFFIQHFFNSYIMHILDFLMFHVN
jgi:hypothetical protein